MSYRIKDIRELPADVRRRMGEVTSRSDEAETIRKAQERRKYGNEPCKFNGIDFDSKFEMQRYGELLLMQRAGQIRDLQVHVPFGLHSTNPSGQTIRVAGFEADFCYWRGERMFVEDAKSAITRKNPTYVLKAKMFEIEYGVRVIEVERNKPRSGAAA
jgi:hypothetical protein